MFQKVSKTQSLVSHGRLILGLVSDESPRIRKCDAARCRAISLVVGDDLDFAVPKHCNAGVSCAQVDSDCWCFR